MLTEALICLAMNIYYEARHEPVEGQLAVAHVVMNRTENPKFPSTVCDVVKQKHVTLKPREVRNIRRVETGSGPFRKVYEFVEVRTVMDRIVVCQFSWVCENSYSKTPKNKEAWERSVDLAQQVLDGDTEDPTRGATHFHATHVSPGWRNLVKVKRINNHIFYREI